jgi:hypothetical protein
VGPPPGFGRPGVGPQGYGQPGFGQPGFGGPGFGQPGFGGPAFGQPGFGQPGFGQPFGGFNPGGPFREGMRPKRRPIVLTIGLLLLLGSIGGIAFAIVSLVRAASLDDADIVATGRAGSRTMSFERAANDPAEYTIYAQTFGTSASSLVRSIICQVTADDGSTTTVDGGTDGSTTTINDRTVVGGFSVPPGAVSVDCQSRLDVTSTVFVAKGGPPEIGRGIVLILVGVGGLIVGIVVTIIGSRRRWVPIDLPT